MLTMAEEGPRAADLFAKIGLGGGPYAIGCFGDGYVARVSRTGLPGLRFYFPSWALGFDDLEDAGDQAVETVRLENGRPDLRGRFRLRRRSRRRPRQMHALHFSKGCYIGQEIVERVRSRGPRQPECCRA